MKFTSSRVKFAPIKERKTPTVIASRDIVLGDIVACMDRKWRVRRIRYGLIVGQPIDSADIRDSRVIGRVRSSFTFLYYGKAR